MARSIRRATREAVAEARNNQHALGPFLGALALEMNISPAMLAEMFDAHEQTVTRWFLGRSAIAPQWRLKVASAIAFISWMIDFEYPALTGNLEEKRKQLLAASKIYNEIASAND